MKVMAGIIPSSERGTYRSTCLRRSAFVITETELKVIAALARMGLSNRPKKGYSAPAAIGIPIEL
jgi:hypothetical protein